MGIYIENKVLLWNNGHMNITILTIGKIKEKFYKDAIGEYAKRLTRYCKLKIIEVSDEKTPAKSSPLEDEQIKQKEAERLEKYITEDMFLIALTIDGKKMSSEQFSEKISDLGLHGTSEIAFVIGGSLGLAGTLQKRADLKLSFSDMTFPHQLMRVILLEQIYRAYRITNGEPYHK